MSRLPTLNVEDQSMTIPDPVLGVYWDKEKGCMVSCWPATADGPPPMDAVLDALSAALTSAAVLHKISPLLLACKLAGGVGYETEHQLHHVTDAAFIASPGKGKPS